MRRTEPLQEKSPPVRVWQRVDMIFKVGRFKSVHRYDLILAFPRNGECLVTFSNYSKGSLIRSAQGCFVPVDSYKYESSSIQGFDRRTLRVTVKLSIGGQKFGSWCITLPMSW